MAEPMETPMEMDAVALARLVGARLTHDLAGPLGTVTAAAGLHPGSSRSDALLAETVMALEARGRLYAAVFGHADAMSLPEITALLAGAPGAHRVRFEAAGGPGEQPAALVQALLAAGMLGAEALPRGGVVTLGPGPGGGVAVLPEGRLSAWPHSLIERLGGMPPARPDTARSLLAPWLLALAAAAGCRLSIGMGGPMTAGAAPPLLLLPAR